jgi:hypothetical protein
MRYIVSTDLSQHDTMNIPNTVIQRHLNIDFCTVVVPSKDIAPPSAYKTPLSIDKSHFRILPAAGR